ncbi:MAG TPA: GAF domain-containing SpoIIE family protein phosphatase [Solirubrobacterales bacterium]|nr:GAF domain-containing SpoIIE family protein phosphatase [Solirubrobacterales bacterium]
MESASKEQRGSGRTDDQSVVQSLQRVTEAALAYLDLDDLLSELLDRTTDILDVDTAAILLVEEDSGALVARAAKGLEEEVERGFRLPVGAGFAGRIAASRQPVTIEDLENSPIEIQNPLLREKGVRSLLGVPLIVERRLVGVLHVGTLERRGFESDDVHLLRTVGDRAALAIEHGRLTDQRRAARHLQKRLLPQALPEIPGLELAARYLPASSDAGVGGDWYDVLALSSGRVGVVIGDVVGKGAQAAAYMGELRSALRAYALEELAPAPALAKLARLVDMERGQMATLVYGIVDRGESRMRIARAGHPYPLLVHPERGATYLTSGGGPPLGVEGAEVDSFPEHECGIEAGSTLLLYTDGLLERRGKRIRDPEWALAETASASAGDPETLCDNVIGRFVRARPSEDDVALLAVRNAGIDE